MKGDATRVPSKAYGILRGKATSSDKALEIEAMSFFDRLLRKIGQFEAIIGIL